MGRSELVMVTGAGGFIGSHLTEELVANGYRVRAFVRYNSMNRFGCIDDLPDSVKNELEIIAGDIRDPYLVKGAVKGCDAVFHLAALIAIPYSYRAPHSYIETNVVGTLNVAQACVEEEVDLLIHTSTSETFGTAQYTPIDELHPLVAQSPYTASKIAADKIVESYHRSFGQPTVTVRPFNTYGPRQSARAVIPTIISQIAAKSDKIVLGSLDPIREFNYVKDIVRGFVAANASPEAVGETINLGCGDPVSIRELAEIIQEICHSDLPVVLDEKRVRPETSEVMELSCNSGKARKILGWTSKYSLREGLTQTIEWLSSNSHRYRAGQYNV